MLDRSAGPLYAQVRDALLRQLDQQSIGPGAPLPTEEELQARFGVSRSVVRQALGELSDRGLIIRQRGRGSVVSPSVEHHRRVTQAGGLRQQLASAGQELRTEVIDLAQVQAPSEATEQLATDTTWCLERRRFVGEKPLVYMRTWIPVHLFPVLSRAALAGGSLHDYMRSTGMHPEGGPRHVEAVAADPTVAGHLTCSPGDPVLLLRGVTRDAGGAGLEWFSAWHRPQTVFDIDARVHAAGNQGDEHRAAAAESADLLRARSMLREVEQLLGGAG